MIPLTPDDDARDQEGREIQDLPFTPTPRPVSPAALAAPPARVDPLNLARRPFLNSRPVVRASLLLWLLGLALLLGNISLFWNYRQRSADKREQIARGEAEIARQEEAAAKLRLQLDSFNLDEQNQRVDFLNRQIAERTFSWSDLLDRITERLPHDVRLNKLAPLTGAKANRDTQERSHSTRRSTRTGDQVSIEITGESRNDAQLMAFVQSLFRAPFADPDFSHEETQEDGTSKFEIAVQYRPGTFSAADAAAARAAGNNAADSAGTTAGMAAGAPTDAAGGAMSPAPPSAAARGTSRTLGGTLGTPTAPTGSPRRGTSAPGRSSAPRIEELPMPAAGPRPTAPRPALRPAPTQPPPEGQP
jgi:Tfp pilus assembly protein PilN